nr:hypothetical protein [Tanacetum cinerariifolium]GEZ73497.1 hypothetical protein [Tanacetum cinerariifolium]
FSVGPKEGVGPRRVVIGVGLQSEVRLVFDIGPHHVGPGKVREQWVTQWERTKWLE